MAYVVKYLSVNSSGVTQWYEDLQTVRRGSISLTHYAQLGQVGSGTFTYEDNAGTGGHASDAIVGLKTIQFHETDASDYNDLNSWTGFVRTRTYKRSAAHANITGPARDIDVEVEDINAQAGFSYFHDGAGSRPSETPAARLTWLLTLVQTYFRVVDSGYVVYPTTPTLDANTFDGQTPADVLADIALKTGYNWFIFWDPRPAYQRAALFFDDSNTSTAYTSTARISNVLADVDSDHTTVGPTKTWGPAVDGVLERNPAHVFSGVNVVWASDDTYVTNTATGDAFAYRDGPSPTASVKSSAAATALATRLLDDASSEADLIRVTIQVPSSSLNLIRAGHRLQVKFSHLPGYESYRWCRVLTKTIRHELRSDIYIEDFTLSPQCPTLAIANFSEVSPTLGSPTQTFPFTAPVGTAYLLFQGYRSVTYAGTPAGWTLLASTNNISGSGKSHAVFARDGDGVTNSANVLTDTNTWGCLYAITGASVAGMSVSGLATGSTVGNAPVGTPVPMTCDTVVSAGGLVFGLFSVLNDGSNANWTVTPSGGATTDGGSVLSAGFAPQLVAQHQTGPIGSVAAATVLTEVSPPTGAFTTEPVFWGAYAVAVEGSGPGCG